MKYINSWNDLQQYGINPLTGEACRYGLRMLCDLTFEGSLLIKEYMGIPKHAQLAENWNTHVNGIGAIGSIMLSRRSFFQLCEFIAYYKHNAYGYYSLEDEGRFIITESPEEFEAYRELLKFYEGKITIGCSPLNWENTQQPTVGSRNVHAFTGRST
jgi:hypothetical protein